MLNGTYFNIKGLETAVVVHVLIDIYATAAEQFEELTRETIERAKTEQGVIKLELFRGHEKSGEYLMMESYESEAARDRYRSSVNYLDWRLKIKAIMATNQKYKNYKKLI